MPSIACLKSISAALSALLFALFLGGSAQAAALKRVDDFGDNPGKLLMYEYLPTGLKQGAPLVIVLHGCGQSADPMFERLFSHDGFPFSD